jgi:hypothetical protein
LQGEKILQLLQTGMVYTSTRTVNHRGSMEETTTTPGRCCDNGLFNEAHECQKQPGVMLPPAYEPKNKPGRPKGFDGTRSRMPSALAQSFKKAGLDWKEDFAEAIKNNKRDRIKLWLKLLPYMITTTKRVPVKRWKGKASRAAIVALEAMEKDI